LKYGFDDLITDIRCNPFVVLTIPLLLGIIFQYQLFPLLFNVGTEVQIGGLLITGCLLTSVAVLNFLKIYRKPFRLWLYGFHYYLIFFFLGISLVQLNPLRTTIPLDSENYFSLLVTSNPENTGKSLRMDVKIKAFSVDGEHWTQCNDRSIVYVTGDSTLHFSPGDRLVCQTVFNETVPPQNPDEFDYKEYLRRKRIFATAIVNPEKTVVVDSGQINFYTRFIFKMQRYAFETLQKAGLQSQELAVALALLTGDKQHLEDELRDSYVSSGTVHLLAVSGLHVGIVFMILNFVLRFMSRRKRLVILKGCIILVVLWIYASIAGLAPSIVRASAMFSIFVIADMTKKSKHTYNNIALSCFIMCMMDPYVIFDAGFQLSYLAVLGIVYFQPQFMKPFYACNKYLKPIIGCLTVTLAAQLGTLPVILLTFKQFPSYFLFSNIILVPYTSVVMYIGVIVIALSWQPFLLMLSGAALNLSIYLMNLCVTFFDRLPYSSIEGIYINGIQCTLLVISILLLAFLLASRNRKVFSAILVLMIGIFTINVYHSYHDSRHTEFGVFGVKRAFYAYFIKNGDGFSIRDTSSVNRSFDFNTKNYLIRRGFKSERSLVSLSLSDSIPNFYCGVGLFDGQRIALSSQLSIVEGFSGVPMNVDYLYITAQHNTDPATILSCYNPSAIIISGNLPLYKINEWVQISQLRNIPCHNIRTDGNFRKIR
jgi:competence protein ComEC